MKSIKNKILYVIFLFVFTFIVSEILLRIFHPFPLRLKGDKIVLPENQIYNVSNTYLPKLERNIIHSKNSMGFRGDERPADFNNYLSILTVGGSTTECYSIADNKDWPHLLEENLKKQFNGLWLNNAGLEGHSTFGHQVLLNDYIIKLKPKVVLFLVGINDVGIENLRAEDRHNLLSENHPSVFSNLAYYSEVINLIRNLYKVHDAKKMNLGNEQIDLLKLDTLTYPVDTVIKRIQRQELLADNYKKRILELIKTCKRNGIEPVLITQSCVYGSGKDSLTGANLETIKIDNSNNGKTGWLILQLYNDQVRNAGKETHTLVIDLATEMPKNSLYFYDFIHYTNEGCIKVAEIISKDIAPYLKNKYKKYYSEKHS